MGNKMRINHLIKRNIGLNGLYTHYSGYGAKCKVEIISRNELLRARGFKSE